MVRGTLNDDKPAFFRIVSDLVNLEGDPVVSAPYSGAQGLISTAAQRGAYHDAAVKQLVADRKYRQPVLAGVRDPANTTASDEPQTLGLIHQLHLGLPDRRRAQVLSINRVASRAGRVIRHRWSCSACGW